MLKAKAKLPLIPTEATLSHSRMEEKAKKKPHPVGVTLSKWNVLNLFQILSCAVDNIRLLSLKVQFPTKTVNGAKNVGD